MNIDQEFDEKSELLLGLMRKNSESSRVFKPLFAKIKLLWDCNLRCTFCNLPKDISSMSTETVWRIVDDLSREGCRKVHFSGGEVFLYPRIFELIEFTANKGIKVNLTTNGTLLDKDNIKRLRDVGIHSITVSLDGSDAHTHDTIRGQKNVWKKVVKTLALLAKYKIRTRVNTVVHRYNVNEIEAIGNLLTTISPKIVWNIIPVHGSNEHRISAADAILLGEKANNWPNLRTNSFPVTDLSALMYQHGWYAQQRASSVPRCYAPWVSTFITPDGWVYACCKGRSSMIPWGRLTENTSLRDIVNSEAAQELRKNMMSGIPDAVCKRCNDFEGVNSWIDTVIESKKQELCSIMQDTRISVPCEL